MGKREYYIFRSKSLNETLFLKRDPELKRIMVFSDIEDPRKNSNETFRNKEKLKSAGFKWDKEKFIWYMPEEDFRIANQTLNAINKTDKVIDTLEDIQDIIDLSSIPNRSTLNDRIELFINDLANAVDEAAADAKIKQYLNFFAKTKSRSFSNSLLIFIQNPNATHVEGYKMWRKKYNRYVKEGAKVIWIYAPLSFGKKEGDEIDDSGLDSEIKKKKVVSFQPVKVYDVSDTEPMNEKGVLPEMPQWFDDNTPSETADELYGYVEILLDELGIKLTTLDAKGGEKGFSAGDHINLTSNVQGVGRLSTIIHELAHELMHWKKTSPFYKEENINANQSRALQELQAEAVSYTVLKHYEIPVQHHATYLALWRANKQAIESNLEIIAKVSDFIINKIDRIAKEEKKTNSSKGEELQEIRKIVRKILRNQ